MKTLKTLMLVAAVVSLTMWAASPVFAADAAKAPAAAAKCDHPKDCKVKDCPHAKECKAADCPHAKKAEAVAKPAAPAAKPAAPAAKEGKHGKHGKKEEKK